MHDPLNYSVRARVMAHRPRSVSERQPRQRGAFFLFVLESWDPDGLRMQGILGENSEFPPIPPVTPRIRAPVLQLTLRLQDQRPFRAGVV